MISLGIDIGSRNSKVVIFDLHAQTILFSAWKSTDVHPLDTVNELIEQGYQQCNISSADALACTGYGRKLIPQPAKIFSEISCHAAGVLFFFPESKTIIDIGGQDSKIITLDEAGRVKDFVMNDKCAAGTGRFLEMTALRLGCPLDDFSVLAQTANQNLSLTSTCVVFAESEIIGMLTKDEPISNIINAVHESIAKRVLSQLSALEYLPPIVFTGGVAQNSGLVKSLAIHLNSQLFVPPDPEITGALGAAILAGR